jgi:hypothetical protein
MAAVPVTAHAGGPPKPAAFACPVCQSTDVAVARPPLAMRILAYVTLAFPVGKAFHARQACRACGWTSQAVA